MSPPISFLKKRINGFRQDAHSASKSRPLPYRDAPHRPELSKATCSHLIIKSSRLGRQFSVSNLEKPSLSIFYTNYEPLSIYALRRSLMLAEEWAHQVQKSIT